MKILIAGCGYLGSRLARRLSATGAEVWALRRDAAALAKLRAQGIHTIEADLLRPATLRDLPAVDAVVFAQAPRRGEAYPQTYLEGTRNLLQSLKTKPAVVLMVSSTGVYGQNDGSWVFESTCPVNSGFEEEAERAKSLTLLATECAVRAFDPAGIVLRLAGIYGPGRHRLAKLKAGEMQPTYSSKYTNRIHADDAVAAILFLLQKGVPGETYLGIDDEPSTETEFYSWLCDKLHFKVNPSAGTSVIVGKRCSNAKLRALGWKPRYADFRDGYRELLREVLL